MQTANCPATCRDRLIVLNKLRCNAVLRQDPAAVGFTEPAARVSKAAGLQLEHAPEMTPNNFHVQSTIVEAVRASCRSLGCLRARSLYFVKQFEITPGNGVPSHKTVADAPGRTPPDWPAVQDHRGAPARFEPGPRHRSAHTAPRCRLQRCDFREYRSRDSTPLPTWPRAGMAKCLRACSPKRTSARCRGVGRRRARTDSRQSYAVALARPDLITICRAGVVTDDHESEVVSSCYRRR